MELSPNELLALAEACRVAARRAAKDAEGQSSATMQNILQSTAKSYLEQADRLSGVAGAAVTEAD